MSTLRETIAADFKDAMKTRNSMALSVLRMLRAEMIRKEIELGKKEEGLADTEITQLVVQEIKKRKEAIEAYTKGGRDELVSQEQKELVLLEKYRPRQMQDEELKSIVQEVVAKTQAESMQDMGKVMGEVMARVQGQAEGNRVRAFVEETLKSPEL